MGDPSDEFNCTITNQEYIYGLCRDVSDEVEVSKFEPGIIVALTRGGQFTDRYICDFFGLNDLTSLKMEHHIGMAQKPNEPEAHCPMPGDSVEGKDVFIVDDITDTGGSIRRVHEYVNERDTGEVRTATLQLLQASEFGLDYVGECFEEQAWVIYPQNFIEDMTDLTSGIMTKADDDTLELEDIRHYLARFHGVDHIKIEIVQPDRVSEAVSEMERRGYVESTNDGAWCLLESGGVGA